MKISNPRGCWITPVGYSQVVDVLWLDQFE